MGTTHTIKMIDYSYKIVNLTEYFYLLNLAVLLPSLLHYWIQVYFVFYMYLMLSRFSDSVRITS